MMYLLHVSEKPTDAYSVIILSIDSTVTQAVDDVYKGLQRAVSFLELPPDYNYA